MPVSGKYRSGPAWIRRAEFVQYQSILILVHAASFRLGDGASKAIAICAKTIHSVLNR